MNTQINLNQPRIQPSSSTGCKASVLVQFFEGRQTEPISTSPYAASTASHTCRIMALGLVISDVSNCPFLILLANCLKSQHRITPLLHLPVILLNQVIQVLAGPDERLSGQDAFGLQFGDGLMGRPTAIECDLLRDLMTADRCFLEEAYGGRFISPLTQQEIDSLTLLVDRAVEIAPLTLHFDIGFIDSPGCADRARVVLPFFLEGGNEALDPSQNGGMYDRDAALRHQIAHVAITQFVSDISSHGLNDQEMIEMAAFEEFRLLRRKLGHAEDYP
jgi:hypothetical protein